MTKLSQADLIDSKLYTKMANFIHLVLIKHILNLGLNMENLKTCIFCTHFKIITGYLNKQDIVKNCPNYLFGLEFCVAEAYLGTNTNLL